MGLNKRLFIPQDTTAADGSANFDIRTYTGPSTSITGLSFQPDMAWLQSTSDTDGNFIIDSVRGTGQTVFPVNDSIQYTRNSVTAFNSDGITIGDYASMNHSGVAWMWKGGGAPTATNTNTSGAMASGSVFVDGVSTSFTPASGTYYPKKISANTAAGFCIVEYSAGSGYNKYAHALNSRPELIIVKNTDYTGSFYTHHKYQYTGGNIGGHVIETNAGYAGTVWFSSMDADGFNEALWNSGNMVAWLWHSVDGFSKIDSYTGNGGAKSVTGLGFSPRFVMIKAQSTGSWIVLDTVRTASKYLVWDDNAAQANTWFNFSFDSDGFSLNTNNTNLNATNGIYFYFAIA